MAVIIVRSGYRQVSLFTGLWMDTATLFRTDGWVNSGHPVWKLSHHGVNSWCFVRRSNHSGDLKMWDPWFLCKASSPYNPKICFYPDQSAGTFKFTFIFISIHPADVVSGTCSNIPLCSNEQFKSPFDQNPGWHQGDEVLISTVQ